MSERSRTWRRRISFAIGALLVLAVGAIVVVRLGAGIVGPPAIGTVDGRLSPCPDTDNCVSSEATDPRHATAPIACADADATRLASLLEARLPRATVVAVVGDYAQLEVRSQVFGFVDDLELLVDGDDVQLRSASRLGASDLGVNRQRAEDVRDIIAASDACR